MSARRSILFVHQNFPGQFPHIARALLARGDRVAAIGSGTAKGVPGVDLRRWSNAHSTTAGIFPNAIRAEADLIRGAAAAQAAAGLAKDGFKPDVIVGNPAWGETLHLQEIWPDARVILLGEYYYNSRGFDVGFDPEFPVNTGLSGQIDVNARNATQAMAYATADRIVVPTPFQASSFPIGLRHRITVLHEGIDVTAARRIPNVRLKLPGGRVLDGSRPIITFISRTLEPLRGFHIFTRALPAVLSAHPDAEVVVIGKEAAAGYGHHAPDGLSWKAWMLRELGERLDLARVHFTGQVAHHWMIEALSISWAHIYFTYPFVLSWSLLEAMACGGLVIGSDTAPVRDVIRAGENGLLTGFFDVERLSAMMTMALSAQDALRPLRARATETIADRYDRTTSGVPGWLGLIDGTA